MNTNSRLLLRAFCLSVSIPVLGAAQVSGVLDPEHNAPRGEAAKVLDRAARDRLEKLARLVVDPSLAGPFRSSAWGFTLRTVSGASEVAVQANLSQKTFGEKTAFSFGLIGPLNKDAATTNVANLDGLVGTTRGELGWVRDIAKPDTNSWYARVAAAAPLFEYRATPGLVAAKDRKPMYNAAAGYVFKNLEYALRLGAKYERGFKSADEQTICTPATIGVPGALSCDSYVIGAPIALTKTMGEVEFRRLYSTTLSISVGVVYDFRNDVTGIDLPLWFIPDIKSGLGGGIRLGFRSDDKKRPTLSLFIGQFKL